MENIIMYLVIGLVSGWLVGMIWKGSGFGIILDIVIGIIGSFVGGFLFGLIGIHFHGIIGFIIAAIVGALILLALIKGISGRRY
jgi:uncharacterized membrane protein YeaQ/YmgE (transglycosylase-associated protein family)